MPSQTRRPPQTNAELKAEVEKLQRNADKVAEEIREFTINYEAGCEEGRAKFLRELGGHLVDTLSDDSLAKLVAPVEQKFTIEISWVNDPDQEVVVSSGVEEAMEYGMQNVIGGYEESSLEIKVTEVQ